jgi:hypothetical protein
VSAADGAPGFEQLVNDIAANFGVAGTQAVQEDMHDWNGDWDILYPFSAVSSDPYCPVSYRADIFCASLCLHTSCRSP